MTAAILSVRTVFCIIKLILFHPSFTLVHIAWSESLSICIPLTLDNGGWPKHLQLKKNRFAAVYSVGTVQYSVGTVQYSVGTVQYSVGTVQYSVGTVQYSVGTVQYSSFAHSHNLLQNNFTQNPHVLVSITCFRRQFLCMLGPWQ